MAAKRLWSTSMRIAFFMMRKGLISKRKLMMDFNLIVEKGKLFKNHFISRSKPLQYGPGFGIREYEFSCSNSPNPMLFNSTSHRRRRRNFFSCFDPGVFEDYSSQCVYGSALVEKPTPLFSPLSVRVSDYSSEDEGDELRHEVDDKAEEFIKRFYEQLRAQTLVNVLVEDVHA
ncbi:uncharacterized protein [Typha latifolia]|uniref:uncharacterized protein n=1 Tax=Typha latifolia TaxID=4733 RepID=UPI003C2D0B19